MKNNKTVLKGKEWKSYCQKNDFKNLEYLTSYVCTHNYEQIHKIGQYYFCFSIYRGYKNLTSLKRLV